MPRNHYRRTREQIRADIERLDSPLADPFALGHYIPRDSILKRVLRKRLELELLTTKQSGPKELAAYHLDHYND